MKKQNSLLTSVLEFIFLITVKGRPGQVARKLYHKDQLSHVCHYYLFGEEADSRCLVEGANHIVIMYPETTPIYISVMCFSIK